MKSPPVMAMYTVSEVSTGHITKKDAGTLAAIAAKKPSPINETPYGWLIHIHAAREAEELKGLSKHFHNLVRIAHSHGNRWLEIDQDVERVDGLPYFNW